MISSCTVGIVLYALKGLFQPYSSKLFLKLENNLRSSVWNVDLSVLNVDLSVPNVGLPLMNEDFF